MHSYYWLLLLGDQVVGISSELEELFSAKKTMNGRAWDAM